MSGRGEQPVRPGRAVGRDHGSLAHWDLRRDLIRYPGASSRSRESEPAGMQQVGGATLGHVGWQLPPPLIPPQLWVPSKRGRPACGARVPTYQTNQKPLFLSTSLYHCCMTAVFQNL